MFEVKNVKNYDEHHSYGTDWVTEYEINSDEKLTIDSDDCDCDHECNGECGHDGCHCKDE